MTGACDGGFRGTGAAITAAGLAHVCHGVALVTTTARDRALGSQNPAVGWGPECRGWAGPAQLNQTRRSGDLFHLILSSESRATTAPGLGNKAALLAAAALLRVTPPRVSGAAGPQLQPSQPGGAGERGGGLCSAGTSLRVAVSRAGAESGVRTTQPPRCP